MRLLPLFLAIGCGPTSSGDSASGTPTGSPSGSLRVMTWNVESVGAVGSDQYEALRTVISRIDPDVLGLNELDDGENAAVQTLATDLGYDVAVLPESNPFGDLHNAMLSRVPVTAQTIHRSPQLSGDPDANDLTRWPVSVTLESGLSITVMHCKSGFEDSDEFRRTLDAIRLTQAPENPANALIMGDMNQEVDGPLDAPATFDSIPGGMPGDFFVGQDLYTQLTNSGLHNGPFKFFEDAGFTVVQAAQMDGTLATRNASGRRIDYILAGATALPRIHGSEIYDARDDGDGVGLLKVGTAPARTTSEDASDHLPVFVDVAW